ncbi:hypothetical protein JW848_04485 [Candidatus Bipolaricaulota bacterium]|nr:hypothetical protein [Candidatus Bipolaricaulota bacterium]
MREIWIRRDARGRITGVTAHGLSERVSDAIVIRLFQACATTLSEYLHLATPLDVDGDLTLNVDRTDVHLSREIDAITEMFVTGLKQEATEASDTLVIHDGIVEVPV